MRGFRTGKIEVQRQMVTVVKEGARVLSPVPEGGAACQMACHTKLLECRRKGTGAHLF